MIFTRSLVFLLALPLAIASAIPRGNLAKRDTIISGQTYTITNVKAGNVVDLSGGDNTTIIGYPYNGGSNQKWTFEWMNSGWAIKSLGLGTYVGLSGPPTNGTDLVAVTSVVTWDIWPDTVDPTTYRIFVHDTTENWDLADFGNSTPGTHVQIWARWNGLHQTWRISQAAA